ncbi:helix-turn-helix domain-containing protein [Enterocloster alcoholdehydrogenati]|uniref:helix-turn-helix domain-containing protein n=1 Tax=Enterocloster alcoholdehydrogenati TaxID=2547410 RepID=UPI0015933ACD|nr:helix-turn-helix transcriptional regulator [Enterocloster alcoholdehydrogenati]
MTTGERIKKLRKDLDLTQQKFGERLGIKGNTVAQYELGRNEPIDAVLSLICKEFHVNEEWLRTGSGNMFVEQSDDAQIASFIGDILKDEEESFKRRLISGLAALDQNGWDVLEKFLDSIQKKKD